MSTMSQAVLFKYFKSRSPVPCPIILNVEMGKRRLPPENRTRMTCQDPLSLLAPARPLGHLPATQQPFTSASQQAASRKNTQETR